MYNEEELFEKVKGHIKDSDMNLLKSLVKDLDEFNEKYGNGFFVTYIDFDNIGNDGEFDPYETFSIRIHRKGNNKTVYDENVHDYLDIHQLDDCLCAIECYHEEIENGMKEVDELLVKCNEDFEEKIRNANDEGKIMFMQDDETMATTTYENFTKQPLSGQLYDLNRLKEVILAFRDQDWKKYTQRWINDVALVNLLTYYANKCTELEEKLKESKS